MASSHVIERLETHRLLAYCLHEGECGTWRGEEAISRRRGGAGRGDWITDDSLPGFKARRPNRLVLYGLNIRLQGRMRWISLGTEADLTPDQARAEAERVRGLKRQGENPAAERDRRKRAVTVENAVTDFLAEHVRPKLEAAHCCTL